MSLSLMLMWNLMENGFVLHNLIEPKIILKREWNHHTKLHQENDEILLCTLLLLSLLKHDMPSSHRAKELYILFRSKRKFK